MAHCLGLDQPDVRAVRALPRAQLVARTARTSGYSFVNRAERRTRSIFAAAPVTASLVFGGAILWMLIALPIGVLSALRPRSLCDRAAMVVRPDRHLGAPGLDRPDPPYFFGYKLGCTPIPGYCELHQPAARPACGGPVAVVLPPDPAVDDVRDPVRRDLRADDPRERDGDDERGLRAHRARQGRAGAARDAPARAPQRDAAGRDDARHGHRRSRSAARSSPRRSSACPGSGDIAVQALSNFDLPTIMGVDRVRHVRSSSSTCRRPALRRHRPADPAG